MNELSEAQGPLLLYHKGKEEQDMKYLKIFTDFLEVVEPLSDDERGRLFMAMLGYALDGSQPTLTGNERFVWAMARQHINREVAAYKTKVEAGREAGRRSGEARRKQTEPKGTKANETNQDKDKEKEKDKEKDKEEDKDSLSTGGAPERENRPSLEEVMDFVQETGLQVDAEYFFNYYEANGWQIGSQPVRSWKAALRAWARKAPAAPGPKLSDKEVFRQAIELHRMKEAKQI